MEDVKMRTSCTSPRLRLLALVAAALFLSPEVAQAQRPDAESPRHPSVRPLYGESLIIVVPASEDVLLGYCMETGYWYRQVTTAVPANSTPVSTHSHGLIVNRKNILKGLNMLLPFSITSVFTANNTFPRPSCQALSRLHRRVATRYNLVER